MDDKKDKKKTLTISSTLTKKIDTSFLAKDRKKTFSIEKKKPFKSLKSTKSTQNLSSQNRTDNNKKNFARKFIEQQATKAFIKKDTKPSVKSKLRVKGPIDKRDFKLTVSRL